MATNEADSEQVAALLKEAIAVLQDSLKRSDLPAEHRSAEDTRRPEATALQSGNLSAQGKQDQAALPTDSRGSAS